MIKTKKQMFIVVGVFALVLMLGTVTYAFFNYTKTGSTNTIRVGRVAFNSSQDGNINLANSFPINSIQAQTDTTNAKSISITITGDTDYTGGVEYVVMLSDVELTVGSGFNAKKIPIALEISVTGNNSKILGTEETGDYYTNRNSYTQSKYKKEYNGEIYEGAYLLVGYIAPNTTQGTPSGIDGIINIKAYIDSNKILISDTYDGTESDNMGTLNSMAENKIVFTTSEWNSIQSSPLSFKVKVEANEGIWVENSNKLYSVMKRSAVRDTGLNFGNISSENNGQGIYMMNNTASDTYPIYYYRGAIDNNNVIFGGYCWQIVRTTDTGGIKMIYSGISTDNGTTCNLTNNASNRSIGYNKYSEKDSSLSDVGYMYNKRYEYIHNGAEEGSIYGKDVVWDGTNYLVIENDSSTASTNTTRDNFHHYTCATAGTTSCSTVKYCYFANSYYSRYIELQDGEKIEDALYKMTGNGTPEVKAREINKNYNLNVTDSTAKTVLETWFKQNLTNELDANKQDYTSYLEDTVFCSDRSFKETGTSNTYATSGWNPVSGDLTNSLDFGTFNRVYNNWYSVQNVPSLSCPNVTDQFSVSNSVAKLNYPIGLITADELVLAGVSGNSKTSNNNYFYLLPSVYYWTMSPVNISYQLFLDYNGSLSVDDYNRTSYNRYYRPVISLKNSTLINGGDGTPTNPYTIKYN